MSALVYPTIHLNGTSAETLREDYVNAMRAIQDAIEAVEKIEFHMRDYYVIDRAWPVALEQHRERIKKLHSVKIEMEAIAVHCDRLCK
jgi:hypothetical protein